MKDKGTLREELLIKRSELTEAEVNKSSQHMLNTLSNEIVWPAISTLNTYIATKEWNEVDTWLLLDYVWQNWPHIQTSTMRIAEDGLMQAIVIDADTEWVQHRWGISEPASGEVLPENSHFDLIIVPVLGFDGQKNRLGLGKGYYDRFLASRPNAQKIGLAYSHALVESLPYESHDIKLDRIITDD